MASAADGQEVLVAASQAGRGQRAAQVARGQVLPAVGAPVGLVPPLGVVVRDRRGPAWRVRSVRALRLGAVAPTRLTVKPPAPQARTGRAGLVPDLPGAGAQGAVPAGQAVGEAARGRAGVVLAVAGTAVKN